MATWTRILSPSGYPMTSSDINLSWTDELDDSLELNSWSKREYNVLKQIKTFLAYWSRILNT